MNRITGFHKGRLGIGLNINDYSGIPQYPLDIAGDIRLTGAFRDKSGRWLIGSNYDPDSQIKLYKGFEHDSSGNIFFDSGLNPTNLLKIGLNVTENFYEDAAFDVSGGVSVDTIIPSLNKKIDIYDISHVYTTSNIVIDDNYDIDTDIENISQFFPSNQTAFDISGIMEVRNNIKIKGTLYKFRSDEQKYVPIGPSGIINGWEKQSNITTVLSETVGIGLDVDTIDICGNCITNKQIDYLSSETFIAQGDLFAETLITNDLEVLGSMDISGDITIHNDLTINKIDFIIHNLEVYNNAAFYDDLTISNDILIHNTLVTPQINITNDAVSTTFIDDGMLKTENNLIINNSKLISKNLCDVTDSLYIINTMDASHLYIDGYMDISGGLEVDGEINIKGELTIENNLDISHNLTIDIFKGGYENQITNVENLLQINNCIINNHIDVNQAICYSSDISNTMNVVGDVEISGITQSPSLVGLVSWFFRKDSPPGWLVCDGGTYSKASYNDLSNCIGNMHGGSGDDFKVPDLRERFIRGGQIDSTNEPAIGDTISWTTGCPNNDNSSNIITSHDFSHNHILVVGEHTHKYDKMTSISVTDVPGDIKFTNATTANNLYYTTMPTIEDGSDSYSNENDIPVHSHDIEGSGNHNHNFINYDLETSPNFIYMLPCIKF
jgi:microcystin-dependent protein/cytoskeletal protein CcmA (bactofilin family)